MSLKEAYVRPIIITRLKINHYTTRFDNAIQKNIKRKLQKKMYQICQRARDGSHLESGEVSWDKFLFYVVMYEMSSSVKVLPILT